MFHLALLQSRLICAFLENLFLFVLAFHGSFVFTMDVLPKEFYESDY